jgi:hypothetical protein
MKRTLLPGRKFTVMKHEIDALLESAIKPHAHAIAAILAEGGIAAVVFEPQEPTLDALTDDFGWRGESVFPFTRDNRELFAKGCEELGDDIAAQWLRAENRLGRVLLFAAIGTLLINFTPGQGFSLEPRSTNAERLRKLH